MYAVIFGGHYLNYTFTFRDSICMTLFCSVVLSRSYSGKSGKVGSTM